MTKTPPSVDIDFVIELLSKNPKIQSIETIGSSTAFFVKGNKPMGQRLCIIRKTKDGQVDFEYITRIAICFNCMGEVLAWLEKNRNWKDGGYFV